MTENEIEIQIREPVSSTLEGDCPTWINRNTQTNNKKEKASTCKKLLIKGPCDMSQMFAFIHEGDNIITEFTYVGRNGTTIESRNHSTHAVESITLSDDIKKQLIDNLPFGDEEMFRTAMFDDDISYVVFSLFTDPNLGLYREKESSAIVAFGEYTNDLTDESIWDKLIKKEVFVANCDFTEQSLRYIKDSFEFIGRLSPPQVLENLKFIFEHMNKNATLILNLGSEVPYLKNSQKAYEDREIYNKELNVLVREWASGNERIKIIDVNDFIEGQESFVNNINHFSKRVYFKISGALIDIVNAENRENLKQVSMLQNKINRIFTKISRIPSRLKREIKKLFKR